MLPNEWEALQSQELQVKQSKSRFFKTEATELMFRHDSEHLKEYKHREDTEKQQW
jgi:hypothetical protein